MLKRYKTVINPYELPKLKYTAVFHLQWFKGGMFTAAIGTAHFQKRPKKIMVLLIFFPF